MGGSRQAWGGGTFLYWRNQKFLIFSNSKIFKKCWKISENFIFFENLHVNIAIFWKILKFYRYFRYNLGKILENFGNKDLYGVRGAEPPPRS